MWIVISPFLFIPHNFLLDSGVVNSTLLTARGLYSIVFSIAVLSFLLDIVLEHIQVTEINLIRLRLAFSPSYS